MTCSCISFSPNVFSLWSLLKVNCAQSVPTSFPYTYDPFIGDIIAYIQCICDLKRIDTGYVVVRDCTAQVLETTNLKPLT